MSTSKETVDSIQASRYITKLRISKGNNWPPPAAMEHGKAPGRPQALLKKDSESDKKMVLGVVGLGFLSVCLSLVFTVGKRNLKY